MVFVPISKNEQLEDIVLQRVYTILSQDITNDTKYQTFKNTLLNTLKNNKDIFGNRSDYDRLEKETNAYWVNKIKPIFSEENKLAEAFLNQIEKNEFKNYITYTPFEKKTREFKYSTVIDEEPTPDQNRVNYIKYLGLTQNDPKIPINKWNQDFGAYKPQPKLN